MRFDLNGKWIHPESNSIIEFNSNNGSADYYFVDHFINGNRIGKKEEICLSGFGDADNILYHIGNGDVLDTDTLEFLPEFRLRLFIQEIGNSDRIYKKIKE